MSGFVEEPSFFGFRFKEGIASDGQLNFYEAGRYRYGAARFMYLIEHYRQTGVVQERMSARVSADFRVSVAERGSFVEWVQLLSAPVIADVTAVNSAIVGLHLDKLAAFIFSKVIPAPSGSKQLQGTVDSLIALNVEQQKTAQERERTAQALSIEETNRLRIIASVLKNDVDGLRDNTEEARQVAAKVTAIAKEQPNLILGGETAAFAASELESEELRENLIYDAADQLAGITQEDEEKLARLARHLIPEIGKPLNRSATEFDFDVVKKNRSIAALNKRRVQQISVETRDAAASQFDGNMIRLDKETGAGRFRPVGSKRPLSFYIPRDALALKRSAFIGALAASEVTVSAFPYRDGVGNIIRLLVIDIL